MGEIESLLGDIRKIDKRIENESHNNYEIRCMLAFRSDLIRKLRKMDTYKYREYFNNLTRIGGNEGELLKMMVPKKDGKKLNTRMLYNYESLIAYFESNTYNGSTKYMGIDIERKILSLIQKGYLMISSDGGTICMMPIGVRYLERRYGSEKISK